VIQIPTFKVLLDRLRKSEERRLRHRFDLIQRRAALDFSLPCFLIFSKMKKQDCAISSGILAGIASFLCCFTPILALVVGAGAATSATAWAEKWQPALWAISALAFGWAGWQFFQKKKKNDAGVVLQSMLTCPVCGFKKTETMPTDACQFFYECKNCRTVLKPQLGDCCVFCSYGTIKCPSIQAGENCC
jgi:hypothetical protein